MTAVQLGFLRFYSQTHNYSYHAWLWLLNSPLSPCRKYPEQCHTCMPKGAAQYHHILRPVPYYVFMAVYYSWIMCLYYNLLIMLPWWFPIKEGLIFLDITNTDTQPLVYLLGDVQFRQHQAITLRLCMCKYNLILHTNFFSDDYKYWPSDWRMAHHNYNLYASLYHPCNKLVT